MRLSLKTFSLVLGGALLSAHCALPSYKYDENQSVGDGDGDGASGGTSGDGDGDDASGGTSGDGDGDGDGATGGNASGGAPASGGRSGTGSTSASGGNNAGTGGSEPTIDPPPTQPTEPGNAPSEPIAPGDFTVTATGYGSDDVSGFHGMVYTYGDPNGSVIYPPDFSMLSSTEVMERKVCANGAAAQVVDERWTEIWGVAIGWNLDQLQGDPVVATVDVSPYTGVTFTVHAETDAEMRFAASNGEEISFCVPIQAGENTITWTDLNTDCWVGGNGTDFDPDTQEITNLGWQVTSNDRENSEFDFCVGGLKFNSP